ncbi:MAG: bifunctional folylpolyglutamate synthase/dihydrofolate synthase [Eubacterium sp.]|nr:bifunctional folylpolyglutamate synthase/dihydrofolate synthase [Eubacterium sp.]MCM1304978.1 bifunctional folylpolyglutamate synthase/dihydrofolate synthase [Butyrivibrio sp.]MCM1411804.1 bifunctional folylpolyglutamate synthase/dihydrofolate synthase [Lachnospiraceae bacterium]
MNEREVLAFMEEASGYGIVPGLDSTRELCRRLGDPQKELKFIHVAGTNGKGSVCAYLASILKEAGYQVGKYISPAVFTYREEIQVNDRNITIKALCQGMERIKGVCGEMAAEGLPHPTLFEIKTAMGFLYFKEKQCDVVILETGMGGLTDATNIVEDTLVSVIASVSPDHMKFLGSTLAEIAAQKAGIMKRGAAVVSMRQADEAAKVIADGAERLECPLTVTEPQYIKNVRYGLDRQRFDYRDRKKLEIRLAGKYQPENAALALDVIDALAEKGISVPEQAIRRGLAGARWPGRFTVIGKNPCFVVDGAHNEDAAKRLAESIGFYFTNKRIIYIIGVLKDKEYEKILRLTARYAAQIITVTPPDNPRALPAYELAKEAALVHPQVTAADSLEEAVEMSALLAGKEDVIIAFGSLSYLGRLMEIVEKRDAGKKVGKAVRK